MTLIANVQAAARLLKVNVPSSAVGSDDETGAILAELATRGGRALAKRFAWQALVQVEELTAVAASSQGALPSDFDRMLPETFWNTTRKRRVYGPLDAQEWAEIAGNGTTLIDPSFQIRGGAIYLSPAPTEGDALIYTYVSKNWVIPNGESTPSRSAYEDDVDECVFDDELMVLDLIWRYRHNRGLEFEADRYEFESRLAHIITLDGGRRVIDTTAARTPLGKPTPLQIPDGVIGL
jgi:hypothetical protein